VALTFEGNREGHLRNTAGTMLFIGIFLAETYNMYNTMHKCASIASTKAAPHKKSALKPSKTS